MKKLTWAGICLLIAHSSAAFAVGAIAIDDQRGQADPGYGFYTGGNSRHEAERGALRECRRSGNDHCRVAVWFESCGAYAASRRFYGVGWGSTEGRASRMALENCGHERCRVAVVRCE